MCFGVSSSIKRLNEIKESGEIAEEGKEFQAEIVDGRKELVYVCVRAVTCW